MCLVDLLIVFLPIVQAVDSFTANQLVKLEEKVPVITKQPNEVFEMLNDGKKAIHDRISSGKQAIATRLTEGKEAISTRITNGKDAITSTIASGKEAVYTRVQAGSDAIASTRAGTLVGKGVDRSLTAAESLADYLLPPEENEKELLSESMKTEKHEAEPVPQTAEETSGATSEEEGEEEKKEEEESTDPKCPSRFGRVKTLSRKVKLRLYYRSLKKLHSLQQQCKSTLDQLKISIDVVSKRNRH